MRIRVAHLYPDYLNIYADRGNIAVLERRAALRGHTLEVTGVEPGDALDPTAYDTQGEAVGQGVYLQVGAFSSADNAQKLLDRLTRTLELDASRTRVVLNGSLHRVQVGPYSSDDAAQGDRERVRERLALNAVMVRRD